MTNFPIEQIIRRMVVDNPWWSSGKIFNEFEEMRPRMFLEPFMELVSSLPKGRSVLLLGPRRVGKTVMIFHTIQHLIDNGIDPYKIIYLSVDTPLYGGLSLEELCDMAFMALKTDLRNDGYFIFFDEIQYLKDWESHLKVMCDSRRGIRFVASGSAAAALKMKSMESGAGRFTHFPLPPLLFCEYLRMVDAERLIVNSPVNWFGKSVEGFNVVNIDELNSKFADYINYGGYPEVVTSMQLRNNPGRYIKEDIVDKVLLKDLPGLYGINDTRDLYRLFVHIVFRSGEEFSFEDLSKESGIRKETIRKYLEYLESAFLIRTLHKIDENARRFQRVTSFKIYVTNPSVFTALFSPVTPSDPVFSHLVETAVLDQFTSYNADNLFYANWKKGRSSGEVDLVRLSPISQKATHITEIKWSDRYANNPAELKSILGFIDMNDLNKGVVTTESISSSKEMQRALLQFVPTALYAYTIGLESVKISM